MTVFVFGAGERRACSALAQPPLPVTLELTIGEAEQLLDELPAGDLRDTLHSRLVVGLAGTAA